MASSSLFGQFLLISMVAIGTLLMIVPDVHALECYKSVTKNAISAKGGRAAWEFNKMVRIATGNANPWMMAIGDGNAIEKCGPESAYCSTLHCAKIIDETVRGCLNLTDPKRAAHFCEGLREYCAGDPKFQCRVCNTDKCNN